MLCGLSVNHIATTSLWLSPMWVLLDWLVLHPVCCLLSLNLIHPLHPYWNTALSPNREPVKKYSPASCLFILTRPACPPSPLTLSVSHCELTRLALNTIGHCRLDLGQQQHSNTLTLCCWLTGLFLCPVHVWDKVQINHSAQLLHSPGPLICLLVISNRLSFSFTIPAFCTDFPLLFFVRCHTQ